jgi:hypothetical protein
LPLHVLKTIRQLCKTFNKDEWQMLLTGKTFQDGADGLRIEIDGYYVPKQEVSGATVKNIDEITRAFIAEKRIVAGIHSHVDMGVFFSTTDDETCKSSILHHLVCNNDMKFVGRSRFNLPCGKAYFKEMDFEFEEEPAAPEVIVAGIENIKPMAYGWEKESWNTKDDTNGNVKDKDDKAPINDPDPRFLPGWNVDEIAHLSGLDGEGGKQISLFGPDGRTPLSQKKTVIDLMEDAGHEEDYGLIEGYYTYDKHNDMYYMEDDTVILGMHIPYDKISKERYIYGQPTHPSKG